MLPSLDLGFFILHLYPFFWGLAWATGSWYVHQNIPKQYQLGNAIYLAGLFLIAVLGAKYVFDLSSGEYTFSSGLGFVFYGGLLAGSLYLLVLYFLKNTWVRVALKPMVIVLPLCHAIGRIGCFFAGCCYGIDHFPLPVIESLLLMIIFYFQFRAKEKDTLELVATYMLNYGIIRLGLEIFRGDPRGTWLSIPPSVWISIGLIYLGFFFFSRASSFKQSRI